jgi:predicted metalloprotease with PDZ domain
MHNSRIPAILLSLVLLLLWGCGHDQDGVHLEYRVSVFPDEGILVEARASGLVLPEFQMLEGLGVIQDQPGHVSRVSATTLDGKAIGLHREDRDGKSVWRLDEIPGEGVVIRYRVQPYDPYLSPEATFVDAERGFLLGYSTFLVPIELTDYLPASIRVGVEAPLGWEVWASWPREGTLFVPESVHELWSGGAAVGAYRPIRMQSGLARVTVLTDDNGGGTSGLSVANRLLPVLREAVDLFGRPPRGDRLDVLAVYRTYPPSERRSVMMGVSEENSFFCLATPDRYNKLSDITALAAHECLHFYLGGALVARPELPYNNAPDVIWLIEGVTEYLAYRLMRDVGVLTPAEFDDVAEHKIRKMAALGGRADLSLAAAARLFEDPEVYELVYHRGFLVAELLEREMAVCGADAFDEALRDLFETADFHRTHDWIDQEQVVEVFRNHCPEAADLIERYAVGNARVPRRPVAETTE